MQQWFSSVEVSQWAMAVKHMHNTRALKPAKVNGKMLLFRPFTKVKVAVPHDFFPQNVT